MAPLGLGIWQTAAHYEWARPLQAEMKRWGTACQAGDGATITPPLSAVDGPRRPCGPLLTILSVPPLSTTTSPNKLFLYNNKTFFPPARKNHSNDQFNEWFSYNKTFFPLLILLLLSFLISKQHKKDGFLLKQFGISLFIWFVARTRST